MSKLTLTGLALPLFLLFASPQASAPKAFGGTTKVVQNQGHSGTLQKMIVENGSVTMDLDLNRLNGISFAPVRPATLQFTVAANSFFTILVFNDLLRGPDSGSMALMPSSQAVSGLPVSLAGSLNQLVIEKLASSEGSIWPCATARQASRSSMSKEASTTMTQTQSYSASPKARLLVSKEFAESLGRSADAGVVAGEISIGATMQPIETMQLDQNGDVKSARLPALNQPGVGTVPGPDVIIGELIGLQQLTSGAVNGRVGISLGTDACNKGTIERGLVCLAERRPSLYSAESLSDEWRRH